MSEKKSKNLSSNLPKVKVIECVFCKFTFMQDAIKIETKIVNLSSNIFRVNFFRCMKCHRPYIISIENDATDSINKEYLTQLEKIKKYAKDLDADANHLELMYKKLEKIKQRFLKKQELYSKKYSKSIIEHL